METVYQPDDDSYLMLDALIDYLKTQDPKPKTVLDLGTGSGILAIAAAKAGCSVTAVDINPDAIELARSNAKKENVKIRFLESDLFSNINDSFDLIVFNPPYVRTDDSETVDLQSIAWQGGKDGMDVIDRFLSSVCGFLRPGGKILLLVSSVDDKPPKIAGFKAKVLRKKPYFFERLFVLELSPSS